MKKKKKLIILGIIVILVLMIGEFFFGGPPRGENVEKMPKGLSTAQKKDWVADEVLNGIFDHDYIDLGYTVPSQKELNILKQEVDLTRRYPPFMNNIMEFGTDTYTADLLYFEDELKDIGVNTIVIMPLYRVENGKLEYWYNNASGSGGILSQEGAKRAIAHSIIMAKQRGFTVIVFPDLFELEHGGFSKLSKPDEFEDELERVILELAPIAEEYGAEYLAPSYGIEMLMSDNDYELDEIIRRTNAYNTMVVPKLRKIFSGKIMYKMGGLKGGWENYKQISLDGADIFSFTGCYYHPLEFIRNDIMQATQVANWMSDKYGIPWMNIEFQVENKRDQIRDFGEVKADVPVEDAYRIGIDTFKKYAPNAVGFTITGWLGSGKIRGTQAAPLVKEFFTSKL